MIIIKYLDKQEKERYGRLIRQIWQGKHKGEFEILPLNRKRKIRIGKDDILEAYWTTKEQEMALEEK